MDKRNEQVDGKIARLEKQIRETKRKMDKSKGAAKNNHKRKLLQLLRQKKQYENHQNKMMAQQMNIDNIKFAQDSIKDNADMVSAMKATHTTLKQQMQDFNVDEVADLQDDMQDLMDDANEINDMLAEQWGMDDYDDDELMDELDGLDDLDDLDADEDEMPAYMVSANAAANKKDLNKNDENVDEYGLPKVPEKLMN